MSSDYIVDCDVIKIDLKIFKDYYNDFLSNNKKSSDSILKKKDEIYKNTCFHYNYDSKIAWEKKKTFNYKKEDLRIKPSTHKLHTITSNFTEEEVAKKSFISLLNKLTHNNMHTINLKIDDILKNIKKQEIYNELYNILWIFIKKSPDNIVYIKILDKFNNYNKDFLSIEWNKYKDGGWKPVEFILLDESINIGKEYDNFCNYIKWKKSMINITNIWCVLSKNNKQYKLYDIINDMYIYLVEILKDDNDIKKNKHIVDYILEQILIILKIYYYKDILDKINTIDISKLLSSSKFILLDIKELRKK